MNREDNINNSDSDEVSLKELILKIQEWWYYLVSKWVFILIVGFIGGGIGLFYSISQKNTYTASLTFVLEEEEKAGLGNIGGVAAMVGINLGGDAGGIFQGDNILELFKSRSMLSKTLLSKSDNNDTLLIDRYIEFNNLRDAWKDNFKLESIDFSKPKDSFTLQHDSLLGRFASNISDSYLLVTNPNKSMSLILVETSSPNESFSKDFTEALVKNVSSFYVETKTKKATRNLEVVQYQTDSVRRELNAAISGVATSIDTNPNANLARQILRVPSSTRQVDVQANQAILTELVKNLEMSKLSLRRETPLIQIIDQPILPLKVEKLTKAKGIVIGGLIATFLFCLFLIIRRILSEILRS